MCVGVLTQSPLANYSRYLLGFGLSLFVDAERFTRPVLLTLTFERGGSKSGFDETAGEGLADVGATTAY